MNKSQKEVLQSQLNDEKKIIKELKKIYEKAREDCELSIMDLSARKDLINAEAIIYQKNYQELLKKQLDGIISTLESKQFKTIDQYLEECYTSGFAGTMYDLQGQGIPFSIPLDQRQMAKAIQTDSKISEGLYKHLGENIKSLKRDIRSELSRGIAGGEMWHMVATRIARGMNSPFTKSLNYAVRIARTEGHRIQQESADHARLKAKENGADVVKQWDSSLDKRTRKSHRELDGQIRELDEPFEIGGKTAMYPGRFGKPSEDCNCRCVALQRARWALDAEELKELKKRASFFDLDKAKDFEEYKKKYLELPEKANSIKSDAEFQERIKQRRAMYKKKHASTSETPIINKNGREITFNLYKNGNTGKFDKTIDMLKQLIREYDTRLLNVETGAVDNNRMYAGYVTIDGSLMKLSSNAASDTLHEFAHTIAMAKSEKLGLTHDKEFWKEIKSVRRKYKKDVGNDTFRWISSYEHSEDVDEFMAEAFAQAKLKELGLEIPEKYGNDFKYSQQVLDIVNKYFKKKQN